MNAPSYHRVASLGAFGAGVCGFLYSAAFVIVARSSPSLGASASALLLVVGGLLGIVAILGLAGRLRQSGEYALLALLLGLGGSLAAILHGGYDLANAIHPPAGQPSDLPSQVDPRGLGTFGLAGAAILLFAWLAGRGGTFPGGFVALGYLSGVLLLLVYLARLIILTPSNPLVLGPAALEGFLVNPAWYLWLGVILRRISGGTAM